MAKARITHHEDVDRVYCHAYLQASPKALYQALPDIMYVGGSGCGHPIDYQAESVCLLCMLRDGVNNETPGQVHHAKTLTTNGNPAQTAKFMAYTQLQQGFIPPKPEQSLKSYRLAREQYTRAAHGQFPFTSALWELMGFQPPLAIPLISAVYGENLPKIAEKLNISLYNLHERLQKGARIALQLLRT